MYVYYTAEGVIVAAIEASAPLATPPNNGGTPLYLDDTTYADVWRHPAQYRIINDIPVPQAYWTITQSTASGTTTLTATLNNPPPSNPPTSGTATIGQTTLTLPITSGTMTLAVQVHTSLAAYAVPVQFTAAGTVAATALLGSGDPPPVGLQAIAPTTSGNPYLIAPAGPGSKAFLRAFFLGVTSPEAQIAILTEALQDLLGADGLTLHLLYRPGGIVSALTSGTNPLLTLTANEQNAWTDIQQNILPYLPVTLGNAYPSGGSRQPIYQSMVNMAPQFNQGALGYVEAITTLPNLA